MNLEALHKPASALKLSQTFMVQNTIMNNRAWILSRYKHEKGELTKVVPELGQRSVRPSLSVICVRKLVPWPFPQQLS